MKTLIKRLPLFAFVLAAFAAFAFNAPAEKPENSAIIWSEDPANPGTYLDVTEAVAEERYNCNSASLECRVSFTNDDPINGTKTVHQMGRFVELP